MSGSGGTGQSGHDGVAEIYKRDFWIQENQKHFPAHYRLQKSARIINTLAGREDRDLLDIGCGPATLMRLLRPNIHYHGIDIAIHDPVPNLIESDILKNPIRFGDRKFDIVAALGLFEYMGGRQDQKFSEISQLLSDHGRLVLTYTNFGHRDKRLFKAFSNVRPLADFRRSLARHFTIEKCFPTSYNWHGGQPVRPVLKFANMHVSANVPLAGSRLAVEYFFVCSPRLASRRRAIPPCAAGDGAVRSTRGPRSTGASGVPRRIADHRGLCDAPAKTMQGTSAARYQLGPIGDPDERRVNQDERGPARSVGTNP